MKRFTGVKKNKHHRGSVIIVKKMDEAPSMPISGGYDYSFVTPPPTEFICPLCKRVICEPYQAICCGQMYCHTCLKKLKTSKNMAATALSPAVSCLTCHAPISLDRCFPDVSANSKITNLDIYCINKEYGCEWTGLLSSVQPHIADCPHVQVTCPIHIQDGSKQCTNGHCSNHCGVTLSRCDLQDHMKNHCKWRVTSCMYCDCKGQAVYVLGEEHRQLCPGIEVVCKNEGCSEKMKRSAIPGHLASCPKEMIPCSYNGVGCKVHCLRENMAKHEQESVRDHLEMTTTHLSKVVFHLGHTEAQLKALQGGVETSGIVKLVTTMVSGAESVNVSFYTSRGGLKLCLNAIYFDSNNPSSSQLGNGHLEVRIALMKGRYDDVVKWPFKGRLRVQLLNQEVDIDNKIIVKEVKFHESLVGKDRSLHWVTLGEMCGPFDGFVMYEKGYHAMYFDIMML